MDKQKRIEEMAKAIPDMVQLGGWVFDLTSTYSPQQGLLKKKAIASELVNAGYGNLKEFAERLKEKAIPCIDNLHNWSMIIDIDYIDELLKEYLNG